MNYSHIRNLDISNGPGCRVSIFLSGCDIRCPDCFNQELWDKTSGKPFTDETLDKLIELLKIDYISGLSILGGEPTLHIKELQPIISKIRKAIPNVNIWLWTGRLINSLPDEFVQLCDVIVDGPFIKDLKDINLKYRGSSNQRVIDIKQTLKTNKICLLD